MAGELVRDHVLFFKKALKGSTSKWSAISFESPKVGI